MSQGPRVYRSDSRSTGLPAELTNCSPNFNRWRGPRARTIEDLQFQLFFCKDLNTGDQELSQGILALTTDRQHVGGRAVAHVCTLGEVWFATNGRRVWVRRACPEACVSGFVAVVRCGKRMRDATAALEKKPAAKPDWSESFPGNMGAESLD